jgi:hypothetical protein
MLRIVTQFEYSKRPPKSKKKKESTPTIVDRLDKVRSCQSEDK